MCTKSQYDIMLDLQILRISQVVDLEELLYLSHTFCGQVDNLILLIHNEVACLFLFNTHQDIHLGHILNIIATLELSGKDITYLVKLG